MLNTGPAPAAPQPPRPVDPTVQEEGSIQSNGSEPGVQGNLLGRPAPVTRSPEDVPLPDGSVEHRLADGTTTRSHGPDVADFHAGEVSNGPIVSSTKYGRCASSSTSKRFLLVYAWPFDLTDNSGTSVDLIRKAFVTGADHTGKWQESKTGAVLQQKVHCSSTSTPQVSIVKLPTHSSKTTYATIVSDLRALGATNTNIKYMVAYDGVIGGDLGLLGQGGIADDDLSSTSNIHNQDNFESFFAVDYQGVQDVATGKDGFISVGVFRHEMAHTMGAVQFSAPDSDGGYHCKVEHDVMCGPSGAREACAVGGAEPFDCTLNNYAAAANINAGSYLKFKWNVAGCKSDFVRISSGQCNSFYDVHGYN